MRPANLQTEWGRLLLSSLRDAGVRDVVVSPGARSTPFTWAAVTDPGLRCRVILDERSAAFFAVGHAKLTGRPVLLICTSGSAAANYFPAVVEAAESGTPLLLLTADRGLELQHAASAQTIDQTKLFGGHVRAFLDLGAPDHHPRMLRAVRRLAGQAVLAARSPVPGPVHLNARARKPLEPRDAAGGDEAGLRERVDALLAAGAVGYPAAAAPAPDAIDELADACRRARRGVIVCGPALPQDAAAGADVAALSRATGLPVVAEPASQLRFGEGVDPERWIDAFATLLSIPGFREDHGPDLVLQLGRPPTATEWGTYLDAWPDADRFVVAPHGWPDPWSSAAALLHAPLGPAVRALTDRLCSGSRDDTAAPERAAWLARLRELNRRAWAVVDASLDDGFPEGSAVRTAVQATPRGGVLALGNSLPIREAEIFAPAADRGISVLAQRGANGIDGLVSGAAGAAVATGRPTVLVLGDVSFAHDVGGLAAARLVEAPLVIVVLNNGGGRIFDRLPMAELLAGRPESDAWLTPPGLDMRAAAAAFGVGYARAAAPAELEAALASALDRATATVVEVIVPGDGTTAHQRGLVRQLEAELEGRHGR